MRNLQLYMSPEAEHILDWWHVTQKLTVLDQYGKGLVHCDPVLGEEIRDKIDRLKWSLWHGNLYKAFYKIDDIASLIYNFEATYPKFKQLAKAIEEFRTYIRNSGIMPIYPELWRAVSPRRGDHDEFCGVNGERSGEQTLLQEAADGAPRGGRKE